MVDFIKISIVTVCYNSAATIEQTIQSVLGQSYPNIEYIIIDGGSTDGTVDIIKKYASKLACWVSEPDKGIYDAMNKGIKQATGELIGFMNSDDWYAEGAIEVVADKYKETQADVIYGDFTFVDDNLKSLKSLRNLNQDDLCHEIIYCHQSLFVKLCLQKKVLFDCRYKVVADYNSQLKLYLQGYSFQYAGNRNLAYFRVGGINELCQWRCVYEKRKCAIEALEQYNNDLLFRYKPIIEKHYEEAKQYLINKFLCIRLCSVQRTAIRNYLLKLFCNEPVAIFGAGADGKSCLQLLCILDIPADCFFDNDICKHGVVQYGLQINGLDMLPYIRAKIIVATSKYEREIINQLQDKGLSADKDFFSFVNIKKKVINYLLLERGRSDG